MGYTHYFYPKTVSDAQWAEFKETTKKLHKSLPEYCKLKGVKQIKIRGFNGTGKPNFNNKFISFNGFGELSHETFFIPKKPDDYWNKNRPVNEIMYFCKTARKPYDLLVVACLIAAQQILGYRISSDGLNNDGSFDHEVHDAFDFYNEIIQPEVKLKPNDVIKK